MKRIYSFLAVPLLAASVCLAGEAEIKADFYVTATGNDGNSGTKDKPFATLIRARNAVRTLIAAGLAKDVTVLIGGGFYEMKEPLVFGPEDTGSEKCSITYAACSGEKVILSGGHKLTGWKKGPGDLWTMEVPDVKAGGWYFRQLFVNGARAVRSRTPNLDDPTPYWRLAGAEQSADQKVSRVRLAPGQAKQWTNIADVEVVVVANWEISRKRLQSVNETTGSIDLAPPHLPFPGAGFPMDALFPRPNMCCYFENAPEMLDHPGEWYLNRQTGVLSYWPLPGEDMAQAETVAPAASLLLHVVGTKERIVQNLHFRGMQFHHVEWPLPEEGYQGIQACHLLRLPGQERSGTWGNAIGPAVWFEWAHGCSVRDGQIAHVGGTAVALRMGCHKNIIEGNAIFDAAGNGVMVGEEGDPKDAAKLVTGNRIANNHIHHCGTNYHGAVGIWNGLTDGTVIAHNWVHDLPYSGISVGWQWNPEPTSCKNNLIEFNHIHDVMMVLADGGCIYTLGFQPGTVLRGNHLHGAHRSAFTAGGAPNNGMFIDEGSKGFLLEENLIYDTTGEPVRFNQCSREWHTWGENFFENGQPGTVPGRVGQALQFSGRSAKDIPHTTELDAAEITVEAWVKLAAYPGGPDERRWLIAKNGNEWDEGHYALMLKGKDVGAYVNIGGGQGNSHAVWSTNAPLKLNTWQHVAMTYDGKDLRVYLDGAPAGSTAVNKTRKAGTSPLRIGGRPDNFIYFDGALDEARVYKRALTAAEIAAHFRAPEKIENDKDLAGFWGFEETVAKSHSTSDEIKTKAGLEPAYRTLLESGK